MSSGMRSSGPPSEQNSPWYSRKIWAGGNDPKRVRPNGYMMKYAEISSIPCQWMYGSTVYEVYQALPDIGDLSAIMTCAPDSNARLTALGKVMSQIKGHDFNASAALADAEKTVELVVHSIQRACQLLNAVYRMDLAAILRLIPSVVKGGKAKDVRRAIRSGDPANVFLAVQYGWVPLCQDVDAAIEAFKLRHAELASMTFTARSRSETSVIDARLSGGLTYCPVFVTQTSQFVVTVLERPSQFRMAGLDYNFATILWERIPFSFVADWFLPVGQFIEQFGFFEGLDLQVVETSVWHMTGRWSFSAGQPREIQQGLRILNACRMERTVSSSLPFVLPSLNSWEKAMTGTHTKNASALIASAVSGAYTGKRVNPTGFTFW